MTKTGGYPAMKVALTGATGYVGSHALTELHEHGHEVTALVQDGARADIIAARGAKAAVACRRVPPRELPQVMGGLTAAH
jgi:uncharacterized protein YbjT (DUF2867 family)